MASQKRSVDVQGLGSSSPDRIRPRRAVTAPVGPVGFHQDAQAVTPNPNVRLTIAKRR